MRTTVLYSTFQRNRRHPLVWPLSFIPKCFALLTGGLLFLSSPQISAAVTLAELKADPHLTPDRLMKHFAHFRYALAREKRSPEVFFANQAGDCDDFAALAADLLREKGYSTKLVVVYMPNEAHVVCYVAETGSYLDYNCRKRASPLIRCGGDLAAIAAQVARSFHTQWRSASEFTFKDGARQFISTEFR